MRLTILRRQPVRFLMAGTAVAFCLFIGLLHLAGHLFSLHDRAMSAYTSKFIAGPGGQLIHYYELKQTNAVWNFIFIHGTPAMAADFREEFKNPFPRANLMALDRPGFGASGPGWRHPHLDEQADAVGTLLPTNGPTRTILVGHSYGGPVALLAALKFTNRVAGLILIGASVDPGQEHILAIQRVADWPVVSWLLPRALHQCNRELLSLQGDLQQLQRRIPELSVPVIMVHGVKDPLVPVANVDYLRARLVLVGKTNLFEQMVFPDYNHFIPWEHPEAVEAAQRELADRIEAGLPKP